MVIDPTLDSEVVQLEQTAVSAMYAKYKSKFGDHPSPEVEPSIDQLSALAQLLKANATPYADMSLWGPHGLRTLRKAVFKSYVLNAASGEWSKKEAPGPESIVAWEKCFKTYKVAMVLLEAADPERLEAYMEHVKEFHNRFGPACWGIIYRADTRMRSEYMERIRRALDDEPRHRYTPANPWAAIFAEAVREQDFWTREVVTPSTLLLARNKSIACGLSSDSSIESAPERPLAKEEEVLEPEAQEEEGKEEVHGGRQEQVGTTTTRSSPSTARAFRFASSSTRGSAAMASHSQDAPTGAVTNATFAWVPIRQVNARKTDSAKQARVRQHLLPLPVILHQVQSAPSARSSLSRIPAHRP